MFGWVAPGGFGGSRLRVGCVASLSLRHRPEQAGGRSVSVQTMPRATAAAAAVRLGGCAGRRFSWCVCMWLVDSFVICSPALTAFVGAAPSSTLLCTFASLACAAEWPLLVDVHWLLLHSCVVFCTVVTSCVRHVHGRSRLLLPLGMRQSGEGEKHSNR